MTYVLVNHSSATYPKSVLKSIHYVPRNTKCIKLLETLGKYLYEFKICSYGFIDILSVINRISNRLKFLGLVTPNHHFLLNIDVFQDILHYYNIPRLCRHTKYAISNDTVN